jgi:uncharacterized coiled-coil protein SlyX
MDRHFLEFWGNFLLLAAKGQKQLEDLAPWTGRGFLNLGDLTALFRQAYGLEHLNQGSPDYLKIWKKAEGDFQDSLREYFSLLGVVPRAEYLELAKKYEDLKEKAADQEETIKHLRMLLSEKGLDFGAVTFEFQKLMTKQREQFQKLMQGFGEVWKTDRDKD